MIITYNKDLFVNDNSFNVRIPDIYYQIIKEKNDILMMLIYVKIETSN